MPSSAASHPLQLPTSTWTPPTSVWWHSLFGHPAPNKLNIKCLLSHSGVTIFWTCISISRYFSWSLIQRVLKQVSSLLTTPGMVGSWNYHVRMKLCLTIKIWTPMMPCTMVMPMHVISPLHVHSNESTLLTYTYTGILWGLSKA